MDRNATYFILSNDIICDFSDVNSKLFFLQNSVITKDCKIIYGKMLV